MPPIRFLVAKHSVSVSLLKIGSGLQGVLYVLDEPSIGLHQRDNDKLISTLKTSSRFKNTVLVVEHDEDTMREADYIIDIGPELVRTVDV